MTDPLKGPDGQTQIMHALGLLTGEVKAMHEGTTARIADIRADIARLEQASTERIKHTERVLSAQIKEQGEQLSRRVDAISGRVSKLEDEDKRLIEKTARLGALGGTIGGALTAGVLELIRHLK